MGSCLSGRSPNCLNTWVHGDGLCDIGDLIQHIDDRDRLMQNLCQRIAGRHDAGRNADYTGRRIDGDVAIQVGIQPIDVIRRTRCIEQGSVMPVITQRRSRDTLRCIYVGSAINRHRRIDVNGHRFRLRRSHGVGDGNGDDVVTDLSCGRDRHAAGIRINADTGRGIAHCVIEEEWRRSTRHGDGRTAVAATLGRVNISQLVERNSWVNQYRDWNKYGGSDGILNRDCLVIRRRRRAAIYAQLPLGVCCKGIYSEITIWVWRYRIDIASGSTRSGCSSGFRCKECGIEHGSLGSGDIRSTDVLNTWVDRDGFGNLSDLVPTVRNGHGLVENPRHVVTGGHNRRRHGDDARCGVNRNSSIQVRYQAIDVCDGAAVIGQCSTRTVITERRARNTLGRHDIRPTRNRYGCVDIYRHRLGLESGDGVRTCNCHDVCISRDASANAYLAGIGVDRNTRGSWRDRISELNWRGAASGDDCCRGISTALCRVDICELAQRDKRINNDGVIDHGGISDCIGGGDGLVIRSSRDAAIGAQDASCIGNCDGSCDRRWGYRQSKVNCSGSVVTVETR